MVFLCTAGHPVPAKAKDAMVLHTVLEMPLSCPTCGPLNPRDGYGDTLPRG